MTDQELLSDFDALYDHFFDLVYRFVARRVNERENTQDIVSETFLKAYQHLGSFRPRQEGSLAAWIFTIARNEVFQYYRKQKDRHSVDLAHIAELGSSQNLAAEFRDEETNQLVQKLLRQMEPEDRDMILLKYFDELSNIEIANILGVSANNLGVKLHRALQKFKKVLEDNHVTL